MLIISTTSERSIIQSLDFITSFDAEIPVPNIRTYQELIKVLDETDIFDINQIQQIVKNLEEVTMSTIINVGINVGIERLLGMLETSRQDENQSGKFDELLSQAIAESVCIS